MSEQADKAAFDNALNLIKGCRALTHTYDEKHDVISISHKGICIYYR